VEEALLVVLRRRTPREAERDATPRARLSVERQPGAARGQRGQRGGVDCGAGGHGEVREGLEGVQRLEAAFGEGVAAGVGVGGDG
jgi:hypothetical protein